MEDDRKGTLTSVFRAAVGRCVSLLLLLLHLLLLPLDCSCCHCGCSRCPCLPYCSCSSQHSQEVTCARALSQPPCNRLPTALTLLSPPVFARCVGLAASHLRPPLHVTPPHTVLCWPCIPSQLKATPCTGCRYQVSSQANPCQSIPASCSG
jgi:hypothetical protein